MNKLQQFVLNEFGKLKSDCEMAGATAHGPSTGSIRESIVKAFLEKMTPPGIKLVSGVLFDCCSNRRVSPQMDLIAVAPTVIPSALLDDKIALVPVEAALLCIEVKSNLDRRSLEQLERHNSWASKAYTCAPKEKCSMVLLPTCYMALDSSLSWQEIRKWMELNPRTAFGVVLGKHHMIRDKEEVRALFTPKDKEILYFVSDYFCGLQHLLRERLSAFDRAWPPPFEVYLKGLARFSED
jgi:hypothetical protein